MSLFEILLLCSSEVLPGMMARVSVLLLRFPESLKSSK